MIRIPTVVAIIAIDPVVSSQRKRLLLIQSNKRTLLSPIPLEHFLFFDFVDSYYILLIIIYTQYSNIVCKKSNQQPPYLPILYNCCTY